MSLRESIKQGSETVFNMLFQQPEVSMMSDEITLEDFGEIVGGEVYVFEGSADLRIEYDDGITRVCSLSDLHIDKGGDNDD